MLLSTTSIDMACVSNRICMLLGGGVDMEFDIVQYLVSRLMMELQHHA